MSRGTESKVARLLSYLAAAVAWATAALLFQARQLVGFPDGFVDEHDRTRMVLLAVSSGVSLLAGLGFVALGFFVPGRPGRKIGVAGLAYGLFVAATFFVDRYLSGLSGRGG